MKRKIFSKLLMVALVIAAVGSFVSCKDYDDDINNLQKQIDAKAALSELTALQSTLDSKIAAAQSAATAAQAKADAAATKTSVDELKKALETAIADAKKAGTDAGTKAGEAITAANKAQETADAAAAAAKKADEDAKAALADALKTIEETYQTKADAEKAVEGLNEAIAAVKETADAAFTKAEAEKLQEQVDGLKAELEAAIDEKIDAKIQEVNNAVASVDAIWKAVTEVELAVGINGATIPGQVQNGNIRFLTGIEIDNVFGSTTKGGNAAMPYGGATEEKTYVAGDSIKFDNRVVVRVSPVNATFKAEDVVLQNSLGETLNDLVNITVEPYKQLITRGNVETGLWTINFVRKAEAKNDDFAAPTHGQKVNSNNPVRNGTAAFAVAINNSKDDSAARYAVSEYGLDIYYGAYYHAHTFQFSVTDKNGTFAIDDLHNRWNPTNIAAWNGTSENRLIGEDETREKPQAGKWNAELSWKDLDDRAFAEYYIVDKDTVTVDGTAIYEWGTVANNEGRYAKTRYTEVAATNRKFTIKNVYGDYDGVNAANKIQYYYVVLDRYAAVESAPSEYQSWSKYTINGLNTIVPATDNLEIEIESEEAIGDIIGFRVFAVNYDGTLADPDGRSFYVKVGNPNDVASNVVAVKFMATNAAGGYAAADITGNIKNELVNGKLSGLYNFGIAAFDAEALGLDLSVDFDANSGVVALSPDDYGYWAIAGGAGAANVDLRWALLNKNYQTTTITKDVKFLAVAVEDAGLFGDAATVYISGQIFGHDAAHHNMKTNVITIALSKQFPTSPIGFAWKPTYEPVDGVKTFYPVPNSTIANQWKNADGTNWANWTAAPTSLGVHSDMNNFATYGTDVATNYKWKFWTKSDKQTVIPVADIDGETDNNIYVAVSRIGTNTKTVYGEYGRVYANISCPADEYGQYYFVNVTDKKINAFAGSVVFEDINMKSTFAVKPYTYYTAAMPTSGAQPSKTSSLYAVPYDAPGANISEYNLGYGAGLTTLKAASAYTGLTLSGILVQSNTVSSQLNNIAFDPTVFPTLDPAGVTVGDGSLLTGTYTTVTSDLTFAAVGSSTPFSDVKQSVSIPVKDVLGNKTTIKFDIMVTPTTVPTGNME